MIQKNTAHGENLSRCSLLKRDARVLVRKQFLLISLNTLEMAQHLKNREFTSSQAEGIVEQIMEAVRNSDWVTKSFLKTELVELKSELKIEFVREMTHSEKNLIKWMVGFQIAALGLMITLMSLSTGLLYFLLKN